MWPVSIEKYTAIAVNDNSHRVYFEKPLKPRGDEGKIIHNGGEKECYKKTMLDDVAQISQENVKCSGKVYDT
ncbi:MAG: hypothetical protein QW392_10635 [Candidatus Jordarchaeales archaeon]